MASAAAELNRAIVAFRRDLAFSFLDRNAGQPARASRARHYLVSSRGEEVLAEAVSSGQVSPREHAAIAAHMGRAQLEAVLVDIRDEWQRFPSMSASLEGEPRALAELVRGWAVATRPSTRSGLMRAIESVLRVPVQRTFDARARADHAASSLLSRLAAPRHADAGPEGGSRAGAEAFLAATDELMHEVARHVLDKAGAGQAQGDVLWALTVPSSEGRFPVEGRLRRHSADWEPLGLRRMLAAHGRAASTHGGLLPFGRVVPVSCPSDVRVCTAALEYGMLSELAAADAIGRAVAYAHASPALPASLRHPVAGSVARAIGALSALRLCHPAFLRAARGVSLREADELSRLFATSVLAEARLCAASVLARDLHGDARLERAAELAERALSRPLPPAVGAALVTRIAPGAAFRARAHSFAIVFALRERFDEDWFRNPRASEPLLGAAARAGELSIEALAQELGADLARGPLWLAELF